ncbi:MAG: sodium/proline symporter [Clostridiales bacterium]|nr:sodium/proline symporter [Clostridiales bacterium]
MTGSTIGVLVIIILYLFMMLVIGYRYSKTNKSIDDFYLGGRKLGPFVTAMSAEASDMSSWLLMGLPGLALATGIAEPFWTALGLGVGTYLNWLIVARKLRRYSMETKSITIPDFFANRFDSKILVGISAVIIVIFFIPYTASGFSACGKLFSSLFGMGYLPAMILSAVIIVTYTSLGGFLAASTTDLIQSIFMSIALIIVVFFGISLAGGLDIVMANAKAEEWMLSITSCLSGNEVKPYSFLTIVSTLAWGLGYFGMPHILLRFMASKNEEQIKSCRRIATVWVFISMAVAVFIGVVGYTLYKDGTLASVVEAESFDSERILVYLSAILKDYGFIAMIFAGVVLSGIFACTMSTADSQLLAASSSVSENILHEILGIKLSEKATIAAARITVVCIALAALVIAWNPDSKVFQIVSFAWAGFGATFGPLMLIALFWKRANKYGAISGLVAGGVMVFVWKFVVRVKFAGSILDIYELLPAFILALIVTVVVSLLTPEPSNEITDTFDKVNSELKA